MTGPAARTVLADAAARAAALDPARSFIVQAPAGSGKTGLLMQRYLALLAVVDHPEEVLAITFTVKATGELRDRVLDALAGAGGAEPDEPHEQETWALARRVAQRARERGWDLAEQPSRLRILTIDALCAWLAHQIPLRSGLGVGHHTLEDAEPLYREAAALTLGLIDDEQWADRVATLLVHLDNDPTRLGAMLVDMLARRDQWLGFPRRGEGWRDALEGAFARLASDRMRELRDTLPPGCADELVAVCAYAGANLAVTAPDREGARCAGLVLLPGTKPEDLPAWKGLRAVLQTEQGTWRKRFDVKGGFPPDDPAVRDWKARARALCETLDRVVGLERRFAAVAATPDPGYTDEQWRVLDALLEVLALCAGLLKVVFAERAAVDFTEVAAAADSALGSDEAPSDLALALDYRIRHLLVDEFQDTSHGHFELIGRLIAGWSPGDGRSLFLVGDPMQSIYRFREADVGLYQHARERGVGPVALEPLALSSNFRSRPEVVEWVNRTFPTVLGDVDDATAGSVRYRPSAAVRESRGDAGVQVHLLEDAEEALEGHTVARLAGEALATGGSVAILVRARSHLAAVVPALRDAGLAFRGVDIEGLAALPVVQDLLALTAAARQPFDRIAWLAALRAPWCSLPLADLLALVEGELDRAVPDLLVDPARRGRLGDDARARLDRVTPMLLALARAAGRAEFARRVEGTWQALGGPACVDGAGLLAAERFLALMRELGDGAGHAELVRRTGRLFAESAVAEGGIEIMTLHKSKGLEFDTVILPGLDRWPPQEDQRLLAWTRRAAGPEAADLLLAPFPAPDRTDPPLYKFVRTLEAEKAAHEAARLLYVGATRARERLHLVARIERRESGVMKPRKGSLLALLDTAIQFEAQAADAALQVARTPTSVPLRRLPLAWRPPVPAAAAGAPDAVPPEPAETGPALEFDWAGRLVRHVGTVVHDALRELSHEGPAAWTHGRLHERRDAWAARLQTLGVDREDLPEALARVERAMANVLEEPRARWLLDPSHRDAASELALTGVVDRRLVRVVIDRTFVDADGVRWIVDYKTGRHEGGSIEGFLDREQERYRDQLERYALLVGALHPEPIRLGLYFPVFGGWREWTP